MADKIEQLMLEQFRRLDDKVDRLTDIVREIKVEMHAFRHHVRGNELDLDATRTTVAHLESRIERLERRLELSDGPSTQTGFSEDLPPYQPRPPKRG